MLYVLLSLIRRIAIYSLDSVMQSLYNWAMMIIERGNLQTGDPPVQFFSFFLLSPFLFLFFSVYATSTEHALDLK